MAAEKGPSKGPRRLAPCDGEAERKAALAAQGVDLRGAIDLAADLMSMPRERVAGSGKSADPVRARRLICCWGTTQLDLALASAANVLRMSVPAASVAAKKGEQIPLEEGCPLMDQLNIKT